MGRSKYKSSKDRLDHQLVYATVLWKKMRRQIMLDEPVCQCCNIRLSEAVHHIKSFAHLLTSDNTLEKGIERAFDYDNLVALCNDCHDRIHNYDRMSDIELELFMEELDLTSAIPEMEEILRYVDELGKS